MYNENVKNGKCFLAINKKKKSFANDFIWLPSFLPVLIDFLVFWSSKNSFSL